MTRPAVIVGLGGTGQWVLTYLKREMLIAGQGKVPDNVRLLAFDTVSKPQANDAISVESVQLDTEEFVHIGGDAAPISDRIQKEDTEYRHIAKWFRNREWRRMLPPSAWNLDNGAGRIRQLGRLALFKDLLNLQAGSKIWKSLKEAIEHVKIQGQVSADQPIELLLVGSLAGGTGSGCFLDIALLMRHLARGVPHALRAYFVLPTAFNNQPTNQMLARSFAAWRELNRFMLANPNFPIRVDYSSIDTQFQLTLDQRLFDSCYLVDGYRMGNPLNTDPRHSVFPTIAEAIATLLDDDAGTQYIRTVLVVLFNEYLKHPSTPLYSGLGSYSFKVPTHYMLQEGGYRFSLEILQHLLGWQNEAPSERGTMRGSKQVASTANGVSALIQPDQNREIGVGNAGREEVVGFLSSTALRYKEESANPTTFTAKIVHIAREGGVRNEKLVEEYATAVLHPTKSIKVEDPSWLRPFTDFGADPTSQQLRTVIESGVGTDIVQQFGIRPGEDNRQAMKRLQGISNFIRFYYGGTTSSGKVDGLFGETLATYQRFHRDHFKRMLRIWMLRTLMGNSSDPIIARSGKLGYVYDFLAGLQESIEQTRLFLQAVQQCREAHSLRLQFEGLTLPVLRKFANTSYLPSSPRSVFPWLASQAVLKVAQMSTSKNLLAVFESPTVEEDLDMLLFVHTQQRIVNLRKEELLHKYLVLTLDSLLEIIQQTRSEVGCWISHLGMGDSATGTIGLYDELQQSRQLVRANHSVERQLSGDPLSERPGIQQLLYDEDATRVDSEEVSRALARFEWDAKLDGNQIVLQATFQPAAEGDTPLALVNPAMGQTEAQRTDAIERNRTILITIGARSFKKPLAIAQLLLAKYPDGARFAKEILESRAEPLIKVTQQDAPKRSAILRVAFMQSEVTRNYFQQIARCLRGAKQYGNRDDTFFIRAINTENPFICTLIRTDELFEYRRFVAWEHCQIGFDSYVFKEGQDPTLIYNFAAEANAARYERMLAAKTGPPRTLHPWVVMLLEEETRFRQAIFCIMMGIFYPAVSGEAYVWCIDLPDPSGDNREIILSPPGKMEEILFQALYNFVIRGHDIRPGYEHVSIFPDLPDQPNLVALTICKQQEAWGAQQEADEWKRKLDPNNVNTFLSRLKGWVHDSQGQLAHEEFDDLATLIEIILQERIIELGKDELPNASPLVSPATPKVTFD